MLRKVACPGLRLLSTNPVDGVGNDAYIVPYVLWGPVHHAHMGCLHQGCAKAGGVRGFPIPL